jgi:DNA-binding CsgD family transcriptional regulator
MAGSLLPDHGLTPRELEVLSLSCEGRTNHEIACLLGSREGTVRNQMSSILRKLGARNRGEAAALALRMARVAEAQAGGAGGRGSPDLGLLLPHMTHRRLPEDTVLFNAGDPARELFYLQRGVVRLWENGVTVAERSLFGEIGLFAPGNQRTCTAVCATNVELFAIGSERVHQLTVINPSFAWLVLKLVSERLRADIERLTGRAAHQVA